MRKLVKIFFCIFILQSFCVSYSFAKDEKKPEKLSNLSKKALAQMRLDQNLENLTTDNYQAFESTVYFFINMHEKAISPLIDHLKSNNSNNKIVVATTYTLGRMGPLASRAVPVIAPYINSENKDVALTAIAALGKIGNASDKIVPQLYPIVFDSTEPALANTAKTALERIKTPSSLAILNEIKNAELLKKKRKEGDQQEQKVK